MVCGLHLICSGEEELSYICILSVFGGDVGVGASLTQNYRSGSTDVLWTCHGLFSGSRRPG